MSENYMTRTFGDGGPERHIRNQSSEISRLFRVWGVNAIWLNSERRVQ